MEFSHVNGRHGTSSRIKVEDASTSDMDGVLIWFFRGVRLRWEKEHGKDSKFLSKHVIYS